MVTGNHFCQPVLIWRRAIYCVQHTSLAGDPESKQRRKGGGNMKVMVLLFRPHDLLRPHANGTPPGRWAESPENNL